MLKINGQLVKEQTENIEINKFSQSLKEKTKNIKIDKLSKYLNSEINVPKLGEAIYGQEESLNLFDLNRISKEERNKPNTQQLYLEKLLKASTPNFKIDSKTFNFNTKDRIGWIILEFNKENTNLSETKSIEYLNQYIMSNINIEPTLFAFEERTILVGYFFPNYPTTKDPTTKDPTTKYPWRLKKYRYFKDVRTALTHTLEANWSINVDNYNETKKYKNIFNSKFVLTGQIFEIGIFQDILDAYKETSTCKRITKQKQATDGVKSGITKREMSEEKRKELTRSATAKNTKMSKKKLKNVLLHVQKTQDKPTYSYYSIVKVSKQLKKPLSERTVKKYLPQMTIDLNLE